MLGESPNVRGIQDNLGFWIPAAGSVELGFWIPIISGISDSLSCIPVFPLLGARRRMRLIVERTLKNRFYERFPFNLKFRKIRLVHQMEPSISVWCDRNTRDQLWRWSTLTVLVISVVRVEMSFSIWQNRCSQYRSFVNIKGGRTQTMVCGWALLSLRLLRCPMFLLIFTTANVKWTSRFKLHVALIDSYQG